MPSHLGPALANAFLYNQKRKWLRKCPVSYALIFCKRYVDEIFVQLKSENHLLNGFLFYLNPKYLNIRFTCEIEKERSLAFLDVNI